MAVMTYLIADRPPVITMMAGSLSWVDDLMAWSSSHWKDFLEWASQPRTFSLLLLVPNTMTKVVEKGANEEVQPGSDIIAVLIAWIVTFCIICIITLGLGFGPAGVVAGMYQTASYVVVSNLVRRGC